MSDTIEREDYFLADWEELTQTIWRAASTRHIIQWELLRKGLETWPPALTDRERCELLVEVANGRTLTGGQWNQLVGAPIVLGADERAISLPAFREVIARNFRAIIDGNEKELTRAIEQVAPAASRGLLVVPKLVGNRREDRLVAEHLGSGILYGIWLFLDPERPFGKNLCRCDFSECGVFFFRHRPPGGAGGNVHRYCSKGHAEAADREKAAERMRRLRAEKTRRRRR